MFNGLGEFAVRPGLFETMQENSVGGLIAQQGWESLSSDDGGFGRRGIRVHVPAPSRVPKRYCKRLRQVARENAGAAQKQLGVIVITARQAGQDFVGEEMLKLVSTRRATRYTDLPGDSVGRSFR